VFTSGFTLTCHLFPGAPGGLAGFAGLNSGMSQIFPRSCTRSPLALPTKPHWRRRPIALDKRKLRRPSPNRLGPIPFRAPLAGSSPAFHKKRVCGCLLHCQPLVDIEGKKSLDELFRFA